MGKKFKNKDLAAKLGVSGTLVSLVLNNKADQHGIRKDTQEKVLALARQMGYFNSFAEKNVISPVEETPGIIGMIVPSLSDPFVIGITSYLQKAFSSIGLGFSIITKDPDDQRFDRLILAFKKFFSGMILVGEAADEMTIRSLRSADYPFILLEKAIKSGRINTVTTDSITGSGLVADHIKKLGYNNIILATDRKKIRTEINIIENLVSAISETHQINEPVIVEMDRSAADKEIDFEQFEKFLRPPFRAQVIIVLQADLVYPIMDFFRKRKLRVPQDIALISMEEGPGFDLLFTPVTCLKKPLPAMAIKAANMVWTEIKNSGNSKYKRQVNIPPELIIRNSCGTF
jgi:LacI family transcriptional regulator